MSRCIAVIVVIITLFFCALGKNVHIRIVDLPSE